MIWLRQCGIALVALAIASVTIGVIQVLALSLLGPAVPTLPTGPIGGALQVAGVIVGLVAVRRLHLAIERWGTLRSGRVPQG